MRVGVGLVVGFVLSLVAVTTAIAVSPPLSVFNTTLDRPFADQLHGASQDNFAVFQQIGCAHCHVPSLETNSEVLPLREPENRLDPTADVFYTVNLSKPPARFKKNGSGGIVVPLFADLKRHDMGPGLAENFALADAETNASFTTARLWGIVDSAPYLHDGRATTLTEAIEAHGGEAQTARRIRARLPEPSRPRSRRPRGIAPSTPDGIDLGPTLAAGQRPHENPLHTHGHPVSAAFG